MNLEHPYCNPGKSLEITVENKKFVRYPIKTHYIQVGQDNYIDIIKKYVVPVYQEGDFVSLSEKIISICQGRVINKKDVKVSWLARFLCKYVHTTPAGEHIAIPEKMQVAIDVAGVPRILFAAFCSAITRPFGIKGVFYRIAGRNVAGIDGFETDGFLEYIEMSILLPDKPNKVCDTIKKETGVDCTIVDANDLGIEILGLSSTLKYSKNEIKQIIRDNPACQEDQCTPIVLIRESAS